MRFALLFCAIVSAGLFTQPADARWRLRQGQQQQQQQQSQPEGLRDARGDRNDRSAEAARQAVQANGGGRVLSVEPEGTGYRVKVLKDGEVRTHHVDVD